MSLVIAALDREIEFFEDAATDSSTDVTYEQEASLLYQSITYEQEASLFYQSIKDTLESCTNDIERMDIITELAATLALGTVGYELLNDFVEVYQSHYILDYAQAVQVTKTLKGLGYDALADKLFSLSMTCDPEYLKEILAKQA